LALWQAFISAAIISSGEFPMNLFERIQIKGFRRLHHLDLELKPFCVLIGANGSGKTSFLDVFSLLAASASGKLNEIIRESGGITSLLTLDHAKEMSFELAMNIPGYAPLKYQLCLKPTSIAYQIEEEKLCQQRLPDKPPFNHLHARYDDVRYFDVADNRLLRPNWEHNPFESALFQVPKMFQEPEIFRRQLASSTYYHVLNVDPKSPVRLPQKLQPADLPGKDGEDLVSCLFSMRESDRDTYETIEDTLHAAFPSFERLDFPPVAAGTLAMTWKDRNFSRPFYMSQLSEGMLRFLWLITLLASPKLPAITLLDEPDVSLHPELLHLLSELMREASRRTQLIVATHADRLVRFLKPEEVLSLDVEEDGLVQSHWGNEFDLEEWLKDYTLDELWGMNLIGGRS
jgi:predicted ATPase